MNSQRESSRSRTESTRGYKKYSAILGVMAVGLLAACTSQNQVQAIDEVDITCKVSTDTQTYRFEYGQGIQNAVHAIKGSGSGEGDQCWDEATAAVNEALKGDQPAYDTEIQIPVSVEPKY